MRERVFFLAVCLPNRNFFMKARYGLNDLSRASTPVLSHTPDNEKRNGYGPYPISSPAAKQRDPDLFESEDVSAVSPCKTWLEKEDKLSSVPARSRLRT